MPGIKIVTTLIAFLLLPVSAHSTDANGLLRVSGSTGFTYELSDPDIRISLPNLPQFEMIPHPLNEQLSHMRFFGGDSNFNIAIITPTGAEGISPLECATAIADSVVTSAGIQPHEVFRGRANEQTFMLIYGRLNEGFVQLNAHIISAAGKDYCIEVHVSKLSDTDDDVAPWFTGFESSNIEAL
ncbi:MAG: hypothetical protein AAF353_12235 [Pseudomonadota bacterium]